MLGTDVLYKLDGNDARQINKRRSDFANAESQQSGLIAHVGNEAEAGQVCPAKVVAVWGDQDLVNLQVYLDGNDIYWACSRGRGDGNQQWNFMNRV